MLFLKLSVFAVQTYLAYVHLRREGRLALSRLLEMARWLGQAEEGVSQPDRVRVAVFGYYAGTTLSRTAITGWLARSQSAVKKHISAIRAAFGVKGRCGRDAGRAEVRRRAVAQGWVLRRQIGDFLGQNGDFSGHPAGVCCGRIVA